MLPGGNGPLRINYSVCVNGSLFADEPGVARASWPLAADMDGGVSDITVGASRNSVVNGGQYSAALPAAGRLPGVNSLGTAAKRLSKRDGGTQVWDGPFAEAKEMVGGKVLPDTEDAAVARAWADCRPAAEWATVKVRGVGPCDTSVSIYPVSVESHRT